MNVEPKSWREFAWKNVCEVEILRVLIGRFSTTLSDALPNGHVLIRDREQQP